MLTKQEKSKIRMRGRTQACTCVVIQSKSENRINLYQKLLTSLNEGMGLIRHGLHWHGPNLQDSL